jgi:hypothetical protein
MKRIPLTKGQFALVDDEDYEWLASYNWFAMWSSVGKSFCAVRNGSRIGGRKSKTILMSRFIMNAQPEQWVDHKNHDTLDNRRKNLRVCTPRQNMLNRRKRSDNTSGFIGVRWHSITQKWQAYIKYEGTWIHLGLYKNKLVAKHVRDMEAAILFREFVYLNDRKKNSK